MATYNQRAVTLVDTLINGAATAEQRARVAAAFSSSLPPDATQAQISEQFVKELRGMVIDRILHFETQAGISDVRLAKAAQLPLDFQELP